MCSLEQYILLLVMSMWICACIVNHSCWWKADNGGDFSINGPLYKTMQTGQMNERQMLSNMNSFLQYYTTHIISTNRNWPTN